MQTFLPYLNFYQSAQCLDYQRLGKQRVETKQIVKALTLDDYGWKQHPAVKMWEGYEPCLHLYGTIMCKVWRSRGYRDTTLQWFLDHPIDGEIRLPYWLGDSEFHASHRSNLMRKDPEWYSRFGWSEPSDLPYKWPASVRRVEPSTTSPRALPAPHLIDFVERPHKS